VFAAGFSGVVGAFATGFSGVAGAFAVEAVGAVLAGAAGTRVWGLEGEMLSGFEATAVPELDGAAAGCVAGCCFGACCAVGAGSCSTDIDPPALALELVGAAYDPGCSGGMLASMRPGSVRRWPGFRA